jgi:hypothetical protein
MAEDLLTFSFIIPPTACCTIPIPGFHCFVPFVCVCESVCAVNALFLHILDAPHYKLHVFKRASSSRHVPENVAVSCIGNSAKHEYKLSSADVQLPLISKVLSKTVVHRLDLIFRGFKGLPSLVPTISLFMSFFGCVVTVLGGQLQLVYCQPSAAHTLRVPSKPTRHQDSIRSR